MRDAGREMQDSPRTTRPETEFATPNLEIAAPKDALKAQTSGGWRS
jgi:hypothetical protein